MEKFKKYRDFNKGWKFVEIEQMDHDQFLNNINKFEFEAIDLPHDWSIYKDFNMESLARSEGGLLDGGLAYYVKEFDLDQKILDKTILLNFQGIYMDSNIWVNGHFMGNYPFGYLDNLIDITDYVKDHNTIIVRVDHKQPSSRWYSGSGIYRKVDLIIKNRVHLLEDSIQVRSDNLRDQQNSLVDTNIKGKLINKTPDQMDLEIINEIIDQEGQVLERDEKQITLDEKLEFETTIKVLKPSLWSPENPSLYYVRTSIYQGGDLLDQAITRYGYRYLDWDSKEGFSLNGQFMKLHGVCLHHDNGALGAIQDTASEYRKIDKLKSMGVNSIRTSHNPQSRDFIRLCDEMGMLVIEEAFDTWHGNRKKEYDYNRFFHRRSLRSKDQGKSWAELDLEQMVKRDKNSPSVFMWSIGNEIWETKQSHGLGQAKLLIDTIKNIDDTRYVTIGENAYNWEFSLDDIHVQISDMVDVVGLNYGEISIEKIMKNKPEWKFYGAETSSSLKSRGIYYDPQTKDNIATGSPDKPNRKYQMSDYGNDRVGWGKTAINSWIPDRDTKAYGGQYIWTGFDYIGEPTPWHNEENMGAIPKSSYFGIFDTCGFPKMDFYFYQSQWRDTETYPMVKVLPHWNFEDKKALKDQGTDLKRDDNLIPVRVYSNLENVDLSLNGKSLGQKTFKKKTTDYGRDYLEGESPDELYLEWLVPYEAGSLEAKAYNRTYVAYDRVETSGKPYKIKLCLDSKAIKGQPIFIKFDIVDQDGRIVPYADHELEFDISFGEILGVDNGNPASQERYKAHQDGKFRRKAFSGSGLVIAQGQGDRIIVQAFNDELGLNSLIVDLEDYIPGLEEGLKADINLDNQEDQVTYKEANNGDFAFARNYGLAFKEGNQVQLPREVEIYKADGFKQMDKVVETKQIDQTTYLLKLESGLTSQVKVRYSDEFVQSYNYGLAWNGSELPAGFSSYSKEDKGQGKSILMINNGITSYDPTYRDMWTNEAETLREKDFVGLIFARAGKMEKHTINKIRLAYFEDEAFAPAKEIKLYAYKGDDLVPPRNYGKVEEGHALRDLDNFEEIRANSIYKDDRFINFEFDDLTCLAVRLDMVADKTLAISELEAYGSQAKMKEDFDLKILVDGSELQGFDKDRVDYHLDGDQIPQISLESEDNISYVIIENEREQMVTVLVSDEGDMTERIYRVRIGGKDD